MKKKTIVIVFYKEKIEKSKTFQTLKETLINRYKKSLLDYEVILYDNSPEPQEVNCTQFSPLEMEYIHDSRNIGIVQAYNHAWTVANQNGSDWLLLLDHDTHLNDEFIDQLNTLSNLDDKIAAIIPRVFWNGTMISPVFSEGLRPLAAERPNPGVHVGAIMAINSGSMIRVSFLNQIGGFNEDFPLDYLDHWLFFEIYRQQQHVLVLNATLEHDLSVMDYSRVSLARYKNILDSEMKFYKLYKTELYRPYLKQLSKRLLKQLLMVKNKRIAMYTLQQLLFRRD